MNRKTIGLIRQCIGYEVFHHIAQETSAYELWIKLEEMYQAKTSQNKALLMRRLVNLKLQRETTVAEQTSEFQNLVNQLINVDLYNSVLNGKLITSMVMDALFNEEAQRKEIGTIDQSESQALVFEGKQEKRSRSRKRIITWVLKQDNGGHKREVALLGAFIVIRRGISRGIVQGIQHRISLQRQQQQ
ncbi:hypothetical protein Acr_11g0009420 [Actinidia rufa]|uniref:Uncharacterized protein n=1 Tax=Actinidia rufa TaxID=165716 RepID=A0A7J0FDY5_9ERIC|nr:hypothetical protein Acr_11g0009420 [Actinidia rufa]